jgi:enterochelin esterase-like enzyme/outer membrane protein assembly factor BamB
MRRASLVLIPCLLVASLALASPGSDWPHLRGPNLDGRLAPGLLSDDPVGLRVAWKSALGSGYSGIVVAGGRVVTAYSNAEANWVAAFDAASGKQLWRQKLGPRYAGHDGSDDGPISTPTIGAETVFALDTGGTLMALRVADGSPVWTKDLTKDLGSVAPSYGFSTTPLVAGKVVVVQAGGTENRSVVGLDTATGKLVWSVGDEKIDYQSPALITLAGVPQVVSVGRGKIRALAADSGKTLWEHALGKDDWAGSAVPGFAGENRFSVFLGGSAVVFEVQRAESGFTVKELFRSDALGDSYAPPVYHDGHLYGFRGQILACVNATTGERVWRSRPPGGSGLILVDGQLVIFAGEGTVVVAKATPEGYKERARVTALDGSALTWPSFAGGRVYVRNLSQLAAVEVTRAGSAALPRDAGDRPTAGEFADWLAGVEKLPAGERSQRVDELWKRHETLPLVDGEYVTFLWRGVANDVGIAGSMIDAETVAAMHKVEGTDLFWRSFRLEPKARWEYAFQLDFDKWVPDSRNARTVPPTEGEDRLSEFVAPGYALPNYLAEPSGTRGKLDAFTLKSAALGYDKEVKVWLPPGYAEGDRTYPLLVVNDGSAWLERGLMANSLDNLVGHGVAPLVVAFVPASPQWWLEAGGGRTNDYAKMLTTELVPELEKRYRLIPDPQHRALLGLRYFGLTTTYVLLSHPDVFGSAAAQSVSLKLNVGSDLLRLIETHAAPKSRLYLDWNRYDERNGDRNYDLGADSRRLTDLLHKGSYAVQGGEVLDSAGWGGWRNRTDRMLKALFPQS